MSEKVVIGFRKTEKVKLPESGIDIEYYTSLLGADLIGMDIKEKDMSSGIKMLAKLIKSWNAYSDEKEEKPLEITEKNIALLTTKDISFITEKVTENIYSQKKN